MEQLTIVIADSNSISRRGLRSLLTARSGWSVCGEASNATHAVQLALALKPTVVILGLEPDLRSIEVARQIKRLRPRTEILLYTSDDGEYLLTEGFRAGARGHVLKSDNEEAMIDAVGMLASHIPYFTSRAAETLLHHALTRQPHSADQLALSDREREIVKLIADGKSNKEISAHFQTSVKTVEAHRSAIMRKLGCKSIAELVRYAIRACLIEP